MLIIEIATENDVFKPDTGVELARILRDLADRLERGDLPSKVALLDTNGNSVGTATLTE